MAVASLRYRPNAEPPEENKFGYVVFSGSAYDYHHWVFRSELKMQTATGSKVSETMQNIVENLRGEALAVHTCPH